MPTNNEELEAKESQRLRELEEYKARAHQMEKTMKWWSDCTSSWREKWSKVRNERNKAREESKQLRISLELSIKEANNYKREKNELEIQIVQLKKEMEKIHMLMMKHAGQFNKSVIDGDDLSDGLKNVNSEDGLVTKGYSSDRQDLDIEECLKQENNKENSEQNNSKEHNEELLVSQCSMLQLKLDDAQKFLQKDREEKNVLLKNVERNHNELQQIHEKCEELRAAKQEAVRELLTLQEQHRAELRITIQEETAIRESMERRLCELRTELERLQGENAEEWAKRERLETLERDLERENKKLRTEVQDLHEKLERGRPIVHSDVEIRSLQQELTDKCKEITDLRHSQSKLKKNLSETSTELGHTVRRAEQYETEVKRLRTRVEELKRELAGAEDELDVACNHVRRLQRTNEELTGNSSQTRNSNNASPRHSKSTKIKINLPINCKPNVNDLKQIFDPNRRYNDNMPRNFDKSDLSYKQMHLNHFCDTQINYMDINNSFDVKSQTKKNMFDFESAKQKFTHTSSSSCSFSMRPESCSSSNLNSVKQSNIPKRSTSNIGNNESSSLNLSQDHQYFVADEPIKTDQNIMNLDDLKVSEDDDTP